MVGPWPDPWGWAGLEWDFGGQSTEPEVICDRSVSLCDLCVTHAGFFLRPEGVPDPLPPPQSRVV